jgi:UDP-glucuronate 4-epimerase
MIRAGLGGPPVRLAAGADQPLQFVHVEDVAEGLIAAFAAPRLSRAAYNLNGGEVLTIAAIADLVRAAMPAAPIDLGPGLLPDTDRQGPMRLDAIAADLAWSPRRRLEAGIADYAKWLGTHAV